MFATDFHSSQKKPTCRVQVAGFRSVPGKEEMLRNLTAETSFGKLVPGKAKQLPGLQQKQKQKEGAKN